MPKCAVSEWGMCRKGEYTERGIKEIGCFRFMLPCSGSPRTSSVIQFAQASSRHTRWVAEEERSSRRHDRGRPCQLHKEGML